MKVLILTLIITLLYTNLIRYVELKYYTTLATWKQYWFNMQGIVYTVTIIFIFFGVYILSISVK